MGKVLLEHSEHCRCAGKALASPHLAKAPASLPSHLQLQTTSRSTQRSRAPTPQAVVPGSHPGSSLHPPRPGTQGWKFRARRGTGVAVGQLGPAPRAVHHIPSHLNTLHPWGCSFHPQKELGHCLVLTRLRAAPAAAGPHPRSPCAPHPGWRNPSASCSAPPAPTLAIPYSRVRAGRAAGRLRYSGDITSWASRCVPQPPSPPRTRCPQRCVGAALPSPPSPCHLATAPGADLRPGAAAGESSESMT